jgi:hypothetical protein
MPNAAIILEFNAAHALAKAADDKWLADARAWRDQTFEQEFVTEGDFQEALEIADPWQGDDEEAALVHDEMAEFRARRSAERAAAEKEWTVIGAVARAIVMAADTTEAEADAAFDIQMEAYERWHARHDHLFVNRPPKGSIHMSAEVLPFQKTPGPNNSPAEVAPAAPLQALIQSSGEFVAGFIPPEYLLDGILIRRFAYSVTAHPGGGKTALALLLAMHVARGSRFDDHGVERGRVLYFASENSVDVQMRWLAMAEHYKFDVNKIEVFFVSGATKLSEIAARINTEAAAIGDLALVIVDTSAATFEGDEENGNVAMLEHAKRMRSLTLLGGGPTVLTLCHPVKNAGDDNLRPRGGGAFEGEMDGNLTVRKKGTLVELHHSEKFRGGEFAPMVFELKEATAETLKDKKGRTMRTVLAVTLDERGIAVAMAAGRRDEDLVLGALHKHKGASLGDLAKDLGWLYGKQERPNKMRVKRAIESLVKAKLAVTNRGSWLVTPKGEIELNSIEASHVTGACDGM